ncbi:MAG: flagellar biosynthetic protein FliR [Chlamydiota bacterium]
MADNYALLFLNSSWANNPLGGLSLLLLFLGRFLPIIQLSPFFGSRVLPHPVKVFLGIMMFIIFLPQLITITKTPLEFNLVLILYMIKEMFIGILIGTFISFPFMIAQSAGIIIDHQRGGASLMVNDPTIQNQSSPLGTMFNMVLIYIFFVIDGPWDFLNAISISYDLLPPDQLLTPDFFNPKAATWDRIIPLLNQVMIMTTQLATPALIAILMTDSFLGIANRLAPQVQITFLGMPLKSLLGLTLVCLGWRLLVKQMVVDSRFWIREVIEFVQYFQIGQT